MFQCRFCRRFLHICRGACLLSPETFGPISDATTPFISSQGRGSKPANFAILLVFRTLKARLKISF